MTSKDLAKKEIQALVQKFEEHKSEYRASEYNETQTRRDFIDPFFEALGWDISNKNKLSEAYRDVIHEDRVKVENKLKSPDYSFRINGRRYFFVEAKKPSVNIKDDIQPAYQVKRYAWSAKLKISIATDFEEFAVYDCTTKPDPNDKATKARIEYIKYDEYIKKFDFIWDTFSKEAVLSGNHEKFLKIDKKKGTTSVDDDFLESLDKWRTTLAIDLYKNTPKLSEDYLNLVVQNTIDRIIFLRIAEDRSVEIYGNIQKCLKEKNVYQALLNLFTDADDKYNSGLFNFEKDKASKSVVISNKCLNDIIDDLYFPKSPYEFSVIPVEILGSAYEQFLGKTIQLKNNKIVIEEKPEVRKAGGVYYTPQYIVDYIVQNTVGKLIEGKTPKEIEKIKILDPASGSGSFLLGAYDYLLKYHLDWYSKNTTKSKGKKEDPLNPGGSLTTEVKKKILLNNIFGVDIDSGAVEVTKLSLLLKCLEGETNESIKSQMSLFKDRVLPTLDTNIKCGNSLVSTDFYETESSPATLRKVKPFNWGIEFKEIFKQGGFDIVIGNPPYVIIFDEKIKEYLELNYPSFVRNNDIYVSFIEKGFQILAKNGLFSYIVPNTFLVGEYFIALRKIIVNFCMNEIVDFENQLVFEDANVFTSVFNFSNKKPKNTFMLRRKLSNTSSLVPCDHEGFYLRDDIVNKLNKAEKIDQYFLVKDVGYNYWSVGRGKTRGGSIGSKVLYSGGRKNKKDTPYLKGSNIFRYKLTEAANHLKYNYKSFLEPNDVFRYSAEILETIPKLIYRQTSATLIATLDMNGHHNDKTVHVIIPRVGVDADLMFLLALMNSKVVNYYYKKITNEVGRAFAQVKTVNVKKLPFIAKPNNLAHGKVVKYVNRLLELNKSEEPDSAQILHYENEVDKLVYELYGLTEDEIRTIEEATSGN